jgi:hypothetical protein
VSGATACVGFDSGGGAGRGRVLEVTHEGRGVEEVDDGDAEAGVRGGGHLCLSTTVVDSRSAEPICAFDSGSTWRGIDVAFATRTNAAGAQCRATRAIATL